jgi:hypothetical protein
LEAPKHYADEAKQQWSEYRTRLSPPRHREARFHDSVPNIPNNTHINTEVQANVKFLELMAAAEIWRQAPASIRDDTNPAPAREQRLPPPPRRTNQAQTRNHSSGNKAPNGGNNETTTEGASDGSSHMGTHESASCSIASEEENNSTDSAQELTRTSQNTYQARFHEQVKMFKRQQTAIDSLGKTSSDRLSLIERQLHRFETFDTKLTAVGSQMDQVTHNQQALTESLRTIKQDNKAEKAITGSSSTKATEKSMHCHKMSQTQWPP